MSSRVEEIAVVCEKRRQRNLDLLRLSLMHWQEIKFRNPLASK